MGHFIGLRYLTHQGQSPKISNCLKNTLKVFKDFKNKQKWVWTNAFLSVKICIFWKFIQSTIHWDKTQMLKKFLLDKKRGSKDALLLLFWAPTHHRFAFNKRFSYELKHKIHISKTVYEIFQYYLYPIIFQILWHFLITKKLMTSAYNRQSHHFLLWFYFN